MQKERLTISEMYIKYPVSRCQNIWKLNIKPAYQKVGFRSSTQPTIMEKEAEKIYPKSI